MKIKCLSFTTAVLLLICSVATAMKMIPPSKPVVSRLTNTSVMVRWSVRRGGLPIIFFKVQYKLVDKQKSDWITVEEDIASNIFYYGVIDLTTGETYRFRIAAVYSNHDNKAGPISDKFVLHEDPRVEKPSIRPIIKNAEAVSPSAIAFYWDYKEVNSLTVEGFFIHYRATLAAGKYLKLTVLGANTRSHIITHLLPDTGYDIKMQSFNIAGTSEFSNIFTAKTKAKENRIGNHNSKYQQDDINMSITEPVSSKSFVETTTFFVLLSVYGVSMITLVCHIIIRRPNNRREEHDVNPERENQLEVSNGHISSNVYTPVNNEITVNVNHLSHLNLDGSENLEELQEFVSSNNEIIPLQTFSANESPQRDSLLTDDDESHVNENKCNSSESINHRGHDSDRDLSPPHKSEISKERKEACDSDGNCSPSGKVESLQEKRHDSHSDISLPRRAQNNDDEYKHKRTRDIKSAKHKKFYSESDLSLEIVRPLQRNLQKDKGLDSDLSPPKDRNSSRDNKDFA